MRYSIAQDKSYFRSTAQSTGGLKYGSLLKSSSDDSAAAFSSGVLDARHVTVGRQTPDMNDTSGGIIQHYASRFCDFAIGILNRLLVLESSPDSGVSPQILSTGAAHVPVISQETSPRPKMSDYFPKGSESDAVNLEVSAEKSTITQPTIEVSAEKFTISLPTNGVFAICAFITACAILSTLCCMQAHQGAQQDRTPPSWSPEMRSYTFREWSRDVLLWQLRSDPNIDDSRRAAAIVAQLRGSGRVWSQQACTRDVPISHSDCWRLGAAVTLRGH